MIRDYESVRLFPVFKRAMTYVEHFAGNLVNLGDALGRDCNIIAFDICSTQTVGCLKAYRNDGTKNEDWYTYNAEVLSPTKGVVKEIYENPNTNTPGSFTPGRASSVTIEREDGVNIFIAHVKDILVKEGDEVNEGDVIAYGGNNGCSRSPHIHVGAWKGEESLQVEFDLYNMGKIVEEVGESYFLTGYTEEEIKELMKK
ncbi:M23 family metallopeptidase [Sedimentibacter sp. zth1]|uniref:M23 family metallopeptidase n=1 Tax=Sedimentibacter sp. zth1 TaxID=2816908 RepID=UPI001A9205A4|nr:M23 family metallopeptidase [Sedimentibacter sp. zth1]QSX06653.1 M23 family metallopeptidase [Sedimentibacter sp. zth1]